MIGEMSWYESVGAAVINCLDEEIAENPELVGKPVVVTVVLAGCQPKLRRRIESIYASGRCRHGSS